MRRKRGSDLADAFLAQHHWIVRVELTQPFPSNGIGVRLDSAGIEEKRGGHGRKQRIDILLLLLNCLLPDLPC